MSTAAIRCPGRDCPLHNGCRRHRMAKLLRLHGNNGLLAHAAHPGCPSVHKKTATVKHTTL